MNSNQQDVFDPRRDPELKRKLTAAERKYIFSHLSQLVETERPIEDLVVMPESEEGVAKDFRIDGIPVLFPCSDRQSAYVVEDGRVVFLHDLVKSAFYLLSAYQEWATDKRDHWGRFAYEQSIQHELGIVGKPVVNYYFSWIVEGVCQQCELMGVGFRRLSPLGRARIHLSHDIDQAHYYTLRKTVFRALQVVGLRPLDTNRGRLFRAAISSLLHLLHINRKKDPYWSFTKIQDNEAFLGYKSDWFFLPDDGGPFPPDYDVTRDADVRSVADQLRRRGNNVGFHAPINCRERDDYQKNRELVDGSSATCRQHFLSIEPRTSLCEMQAAGLKADCTMGFSTHEGFRVSYCLPYRPFDHRGQRMLEIVELPLTMMDVTVLGHRQMSFDEIFLRTEELIEEVRRFDGVFSLLWHNSTFDEVYYPGINKFYEDLHLMFSQYQLRHLLLSDLVE